MRVCMCFLSWSSCSYVSLLALSLCHLCHLLFTLLCLLPFFLAACVITSRYLPCHHLTFFTYLSTCLPDSLTVRLLLLLLWYAAIQLRSRFAFFSPFINKDINTALIYVRYFKFGTVRVGNCSPSIIAVKNGLWLVTENPQLFSSRVDYLKGDGSPA